MKKYSADDERAIRVERLVREWTRSGLLEKNQEDLLLYDVRVDLRRTNLFLRLLMFGFGVLILLAAVVLVGVTLELRTEISMARLCLFGAAASFGICEWAITKFRLYRFGIEEAAAVVAGILIAAGAMMWAAAEHVGLRADFPMFLGLLMGVAAGLAIYLRFGYVYAAIAGMLCLTIAPFETGLTPVSQRLAAASLLLLVFIIARSRLAQGGNDFPSDDYSVIQAIAWAGVYVCLNLQLSSFVTSVTAEAIVGSFYWFTFVAVWLLPVIGLFLALRDRDRLLLDCSIVMSLVTLATNKPYLGAMRQTWDPILLGVFLIGMVVALRRWLGPRDRYGFTSERILLADKRGIAVVGTASAALHTIPQMPAAATPVAKLEPGGGRSGGAGASGSF
jgi:hypothetical protein